MKKRVKLLTTIASLCLAVALMAFGVYAATQQSMSVSSTVSFTAQVDVTFSWSVKGGNVEGTAVDVSGTKTFNAQADKTTLNLNDADATESKAIPAAISFNNKDNDTITYTFTCVNNGDSDITLTIDHEALEASYNNDNLLVTYKVDGVAKAWGTSVTVQPAATDADGVTLSVEFKMVDPATGAPETTLTAEFTAGH